MHGDASMTLGMGLGPILECHHRPALAAADHVQGLSVPIACVGSGDPVRVLHLYTTNTLDIF